MFSPNPSTSAQLQIHLRNAFDTNNLHAVQHILLIVDTKGVPIVNLNAQISLRSPTALHYALSESLQATPLFRLNIDIIRVLLNVRDNEGNLVLDLNKESQYSTEPLRKCIQSQSLDPELLDGKEVHAFDSKNPKHIERRRLSRELFEMMIEARSAKGKLLYNITPSKAKILLREAIDVNDEQIVQHLLDRRHADGRRAIDPRGISFGGEESIIEYAGRPHGTAGNPASPVIVDILLNAIFRIAQEEKVHVEEIKETKGNKILSPQMQFIISGGQTTHLTEVTFSVNASIQRLRKRYVPSTQSPLENITVCLSLEEQTAAMKEIKEYLDKDEEHFAEVYYARICLYRCNTESTQRFQIESTLKEAIALVWKGINDHKLEGFSLTETDFLHRRRSLINNLIHVTRHYQPKICFMGLFNKIVETLDCLHPDIQIAITPQQVREQAVNKVINIFQQAFSQKPQGAKSSIFKNLYKKASETKSSEKSLSDLKKFIEETRSLCKDALDKDFKSTLFEKNKEDIIQDHLDNLPYPIKHEKLRHLLEDIANLEHTEKSFDTESKQQQNALSNEFRKLLQSDHQVLFSIESDLQKLKTKSAAEKGLPIIIKNGKNIYICGQKKVFGKR